MLDPTSLQILRATRSLSPVTTLTATPCLLQGLDRRGGALSLRRIEECDVALQDQIALVGLAVRGGAGRRAARLDVLGGDGEHAEAVGAELLVFLFEILDVRGGPSAEARRRARRSAAGEDRLRSALAR